MSIFRHGYGAIRKPLPNGDYERIYMGDWIANLRHGLGKQFFTNGIYYGQWENDKRHGLGIMWFYDNGAFYIGEWKLGKFDGAGVFFLSNYI